jgi:hypothetical protein
MLINSLLYNALLILLAVSVAVGLIVFFKKKFNNYYGIILAIIVVSMLCPFLYLTPGKMYVINKELEVEDYRFIGKTEHNVGAKMQVFEVDRSKVFVINNSDKELALEEIIYGSRFSVTENKIYFILPYTSGSFDLPGKEIDFLFNDEIPQEIEQHGSKGRVSKYWLHFTEEEE